MPQNDQMNSDFLAGDMVREIASHLNDKDFKQLRNTCAFFARTTFSELVKRVKDQSVVDFKTGSSRTLMLKGDGTVWVAGLHWMGGHGVIKNTFTQIKGIKDVCQIAVGEQPGIFIFLKKDGSVWLHTSDDHFPKCIENLSHVCQIACHVNHALFLKKDGTVWGCGLNAYGQLGLGDDSTREMPTQIPGLTHIRQIFTGQSHSVFVRQDGMIFVCGANHCGQLGLGDLSESPTPACLPQIDDLKQMVVGSTHTLFLKKDGTVWGMGNNLVGQLGQGDTCYKTPRQIPHLQDIDEIAAGDDRSMFLKKNGSVLILGYQFGKREPNFTRTPDEIACHIVKIHLSESCAFLIKKEGSIFAIGVNFFGELGLGDYENRSLPTKLSLVSTENAVALTEYHEEMERKRMR